MAYHTGFTIWRVFQNILPIDPDQSAFGTTSNVTNYHHHYNRSQLRAFAHIFGILHVAHVTLRTCIGIRIRLGYSVANLATIEDNRAIICRHRIFIFCHCIIYLKSCTQ